jgi:hypothetical protein
MSTLTSDQRWLLLHMGGWQIEWALLSPAGTDHLMTSMWGQCGGRAPEGGPEWLTSFETRGGKVTAPYGTGEPPKVTVTAAQINRYGAALPPEIRVELEASRKASRAHAAKAEGWCHCPWKDRAPNAHSGPCTRYHPTEAEYEAHLEEGWQLRDRQRAALRRALQIDQQAEQLALFG